MTRICGGLTLVVLSVFLWTGCSQQAETELTEPQKDPIEGKIELSQSHLEEETPLEDNKETEEAIEDSNQSDEVVDIPNNDATVEEMKDGVYRNNEFQFTLSIPIHWTKVIRIESSDLWGEEEGTSINFYYQPDLTIQSLVFSIDVYDKEIPPDVISENPFSQYIATHDGRTFAYTMPSEPAAELFEANNNDKLDFVTKMMNEDVPEVIKTFSTISKLN